MHPAALPGLGSPTVPAPPRSAISRAERLERTLLDRSAVRVTIRALLGTLIAAGCTSVAGDPVEGSVADGGRLDAGEEPAGDAAADATYLRDSAFGLAALDTGNIDAACTMLAPWGGESWGVEAATFSDPDDRTIDTARFIATGENGYLYGLETRGRWGFTRFIQGDVWGGGNCGAIPWHRFEPIAIAGEELSIDLDLYRDTSNLFATDDSWIMFAVNLWFSSPDLPQAGDDLNGRKPLVMDLVLHHECTIADCGLETRESETAYHYQAVVGEAPLREWRHASIALAPHIEAALAHFDLPPEAQATLALYQAEVVIELHRAEGAASVDNVVLR